jgi:hypothetical protein
MRTDRWTRRDPATSVLISHSRLGGVLVSVFATGTKGQVV